MVIVHVLAVAAFLELGVLGVLGAGGGRRLPEDDARDAHAHCAHTDMSTAARQLLALVPHVCARSPRSRQQDSLPLTLARRSCLPHATIPPLLSERIRSSMQIQDLLHRSCGLPPPPHSATRGRSTMRARTEPRPRLLAAAVLEERRHHRHLALRATHISRQHQWNRPDWRHWHSRGWGGRTCWGAVTVRRRLAVRRALARGAICSCQPTRQRRSKRAQWRRTAPVVSIQTHPRRVRQSALAPSRAPHTGRNAGGGWRQ